MLSPDPLMALLGELPGISPQRRAHMASYGSFPIQYPNIKKALGFVGLNAEHP